jgi:hypothetical protein
MTFQIKIPFLPKRIATVLTRMEGDVERAQRGEVLRVFWGKLCLTKYV